MKKILMGVGGTLVVAVLAVLAAASMQPDKAHIERSLVVAAAPDDVFPLANNLDAWLKWNPWQNIDPSQKTTFSEGSHEGVGAWYEWEGNKDVGHGKMTIKESVPGQKVVEELHFIEPFDATAEVAFTFTAVGDKTKVTWTYDATNPFMSKVFGLFMNMDEMLGGDFERGLNSLKPLAEAAAQTRVATEQAAAEAAAQEAALATPVADATGTAVPAEPVAAPK